jgi:hypothetical protein
MGLDTKKMETLLLAMLEVLKSDSEETPTKAPAAKKRGRPKGSSKKATVTVKAAVEPEAEPEEDNGEVHQIKKKGAEVKSKKPLPGQKNLFNPKDYKVCEDEGTSEWKRLKDGGIIKSKRRESYKECNCSDCGKPQRVLMELYRSNYICDRCEQSKIGASRE